MYEHELLQGQAQREKQEREQCLFFFSYSDFLFLTQVARTRTTAATSAEGEAGEGAQGVGDPVGDTAAKGRGGQKNKTFGVRGAEKFWEAGAHAQGEGRSLLNGIRSLLGSGSACQGEGALIIFYTFYVNMSKF